MERSALSREIATMKLVRARTSIPVPQIFDFEPSAEQPLKFPYVLMEHLPGQAMSTRLAKSVLPECLEKVASQMAQVFSELQKVNFDRIGRLWAGERADQGVEIIPMSWHPWYGPLATSLEYFYGHRQAKSRKWLTE